MNSTASVVERTYQKRGVNEQHPLFLREAIDPDAALVEQLRGGDAGAAEALVGAYGDRVYRLAIRITGNAADAEEVVQDTLWAVTRKIDTFRGGRPPSAPGCTGSPPTRPTRSCGDGGACGPRCHGKSSLRHNQRLSKLTKVGLADSRPARYGLGRWIG
jgi:hypothetical protein